MNRKKLDNLRAEVDGWRRTQAKCSDLQGLARRIGLKPVKRGKEPTYECDDLPSIPPLTIPGHKGRDLARGTRNSVLDHLDNALDAWDAIVTEQEREAEQGLKNGPGRN
jgi:hypothetical protein